MKFTVEMDYYDMLTLWSYCKVEVNNLREINPNSPVYGFLQTEADKLEKIMGALDKSMNEATIVNRLRDKLDEALVAE